MKSIKDYVDRIEEELEDAETYGERYIECKAKNEMQKASRYNEMANDELKHATFLHEWAVAEIEKISKVYQPPPEMEEKWKKSHKNFVHKAAWIKQMLAM